MEILTSLFIQTLNFISSHLYFLAGIYFTLLYIIILFRTRNKNIKSTSCKIGIFTMILGIYVQPTHLQDWWHPAFIFDTFIKIEDLLFGFSSGALMVLIYGNVSSFYKIERKEMPRIVAFGIPLICIILFGILFWVFGVHSFLNSIIVFSLMTAVIAVLRPKALLPAFITAVIIVALAIPGYRLGIFLNHQWIQQEWFLDKLSGTLFIGIPIEELYWYFFGGLAISSFYEMLRKGQDKFK